MATVRRKPATIDLLNENITAAAAAGDQEFVKLLKAAKEKMSMIAYKKQLLNSHAPFRFIEYNEIGTEEVGFGNKVSIQEEGKDEPEDYYILGPIEFELDLYPMIVTYHSPFGQNVIGKKVGDEFILTIRRKETKFTITSIEKVSSEQN